MTTAKGESLGNVLVKHVKYRGISMHTESVSSRGDAGGLNNPPDRKGPGAEGESEGDNNGEGTKAENDIREV
jgi:hypothetical protein